MVLEYKYANIILILIVSFLIGSLALLASCRADESPVIPTSGFSLPAKKIPAYSLEISYPGERGKFTVKTGESVVIPVSIRSIVDRPIDVQLVVVTVAGQLPQFLTYSQPHESITLAPGASLETRITLNISEDAVQGKYHISVHGNLLTPIEGRTTETMFFDLIVIDDIIPSFSQNESPTAALEPIIDYSILLTKLRESGAAVEEAGSTKPWGTLIAAKVIQVNGSSVQVYEYDTPFAMQSYSSDVSPDGYRINSSNVRWIGPPHLFRSGRIFVTYIGSDQAIMDMLTKILGAQFAGR